MLVRLMVALAVVGLSACAQVGAEPEPLVCGDSPCAVTHEDDPPRGRVLVCEACADTESAYYVRAMDLGCPLEQWPHDLCDISDPKRACDYAALVGLWQQIDAAASCDGLDTVARVDPCTAPDPAIYWRENGGCE